MRRKQIAIVSIEDDLHALIIQKALEKYSDLECHIIESDRISGRAILNWSNVPGCDSECRVPAMGGHDVDVSNLNVIWWRRAGYPQRIASFVVDPTHIDLINNECRVALIGLLLNEFRGTWINHPINTQLAGNKLLQLRAAWQAEFRVPRTLVSQDPAAIRKFCEQLNYKVVVKAIRGTSEAPLLTKMLAPDHLASDDSIALCPAIYQEYIPGERHIRAQCFGDAVYSAVVKSQDLDWRANLNVPFEVVELPEDIRTRLRNVLKILGLKMGVVDLKLTEEGEPVWFEVNPQGQFLFVEALAGLDLTLAFVDFLYQEATQAFQLSG